MTLRDRIQFIVVHCSDSPQGRGDTAETIHEWHLKRGWDGIGYHWVILEDGTVQAGRPEYWFGAHVKHHNADSIGVCLIGRDRFTVLQMRALKQKLREVHERYPWAAIVGHRDLDDSKTCPNFDVRDIVDDALTLPGT